MSGIKGAWFGVALVGLTCLGCRGTGPQLPTARLEGRVTVDGQPVGEGTIVFIPEGRGQAQPTQASIRDGHYSASGVPLGKVLVRFIATKKTGKVTPIPNSTETIEEVINIIPGKYELGIPIEVQTDNPAQDFALTSQ